MLRKFLIATAALAAMTGQATASSLGIGESVSGTSATIYLSTFNPNAPLEGGINLMGPGQGGGGTNYAFDTNYAGGANPAGFTGYDAGPFTGPVVDWQSVTIGGLAVGDYTYLFTDAVGGNVTYFYSPWTHSYADYKGTFSIVSVVPLPATLPLYGAGLAVLGFVGWRRKQRQVTA